jgi:hypothetical protein
MHKRIAQLLGGLLAVTALAVAPVAATADAPSTARASGGGSDNEPPSSNWGNGWWGHDENGPYWGGWDDGDGDFGGHAWDNNSNGDNGSNDSQAARLRSRPRAGKVDRVMVAVDRLRGSRCQRLGRSDRLGRPVDCSRTRWMKASGTRRWHYHIAKTLPQGRYRLHRRAIDAAGNRERPHVRTLRIR